jgi:hypothetical protein
VSIKKKFNIIDGVLRVFYGCISGLIVAIGIKAHVIFDFFDKVPSHFYLILFLGIISGASEVIIPHLVKQVEKRA